MFDGDCNTNYIEIRTGSSKSRILKKVCVTEEPRAVMKTYASKVFMRFVKTSSSSSSFEAQWSLEDVSCCNQISLGNFFFLQNLGK